MTTINETIDTLGIPKSEFDKLSDIDEKVNISGEYGPINGYCEPKVGFDNLFGGFSIKDILLTETGNPDDYINHPLNFCKSEGLGQIIQGLTGFAQKLLNIQSLKLALLDVIFGYLKFKKEGGMSR